MPSQGSLCTSLSAVGLGGAGGLKAGCWEVQKLDVVSLDFGSLRIDRRYHSWIPGTTWYKRALSLTDLMGLLSNHSLARQTPGHLGRGLSKSPCQLNLACGLRQEAQL